MRYVAPLPLTATALALVMSLSTVAAEPPAPPPSAPGLAAPGQAPTAAATAPNPAAVVATVNGVTINRAELDRATQAMLTQARMPPPADPQQRQQLEAKALETVIAQELLYQAAQKIPVPDLDNKVNDRFQATQARLGGPEAFEKALGQRGITAEEFKSRLRRDLLTGAFIDQEVNAKISITPEQARQYYDANPDKFKQPETIHASHILIGVDAKASAEDKQAARRKADEILAQIKGGADFAELAKAESSCPSAKQGGDLGTFGRGQMVKPFEEAAFSLNEGAVSEVVETQFGYHIIKSQARNPSGTLPFEQVQDKIQAQLKSAEAKKQLAAKVETLRQAAKIEQPAQGN